MLCSVDIQTSLLFLAMGPAPAKPVIKSEGPAVIDESPSVESSQVRKSLSLSQVRKSVYTSISALFNRQSKQVFESTVPE